MITATLELDLKTDDVPGNLRLVLHGLERAAAHGVQLLAVPEMWPTSFLANAGPAEFESSAQAVSTLARAAEAAGVVVVGSAFHLAEARPDVGAGGGPEPVSTGEDSLPTNRAHVLCGGSTAAYFDKVHLFSPTAEHLAFRGGEAPPPVFQMPGDGPRISPIICYDLRFPDVAREAYRAGAEVLVVVAQWPTPRIAHWDALVRGRAVDSQAFVIAANRVGGDVIGRRRMKLEFPGHSVIVGPSGERVEPSVVESIPMEHRADGRLEVASIDLDEVRALRRLVPVLRDERTDVLASWLQPRAEAGGCG